MNAQAAVNLLSPKKYPAQYSRKNMRSNYVQQLNLAYKQSLSYIGSDDGLVPSNIFYSVRRNLGGFQQQDIGVSISTSGLTRKNILVLYFLDQTL